MFLKQLQNKKGKKYQALMIFELMTCAKLLYRWAWSSQLGAGHFVNTIVNRRWNYKFKVNINKNKTVKFLI